VKEESGSKAEGKNNMTNVLVKRDLVSLLFYLSPSGDSLFISGCVC